jgi:hypothetical protein
LAFAIAIVATLPAGADTLCGAMACRANGAPYVNDKGAIVIYPGEHFAVAFTIENHKIMSAAPKPVDGQVANTIELNFARDGNGMLLTLQSNLSDTVKYDTTMKAPDNRMVYTSSCAVDAGRQNYESWPHEIKFLDLSNFRFENEHVCG